MYRGRLARGRKVMMMCKEATRLMSLKQDRPLTFQERVSLRIHLSMCGACRECDRQFILLHKAGDRLRTDLDEADR
ncbi:zf-HC2 domain-containing protein [Halomonas sp. SSL-5]|uniref:zf-HC2 domain-containing protein n=1 Tax=unclassified Halomonas TaxID=2609666 RepID=UPI002AA2AEC7|nr:MULTISPECIES: zf-HC2 domain-containing protein [unclassified Halomonas]MDY7115028.1 zf-HC2 domain-containing protein [Halomonas sp. SSL-5]